MKSLRMHTGCNGLRIHYVAYTKGLTRQRKEHASIKRVILHMIFILSTSGVKVDQIKVAFYWTIITYQHIVIRRLILGMPTYVVYVLC